MKAQLVFAFPFDVSLAEVVQAVSDHFGVSVNAAVPEHIKRAVESIGQDNPENGVEVSAAVAFGHLINGAAGNVNGASGQPAPYTAVAEMSTIAPVVPMATSATQSVPPAPVPGAPGMDAPSAPANTASPVSNGPEFDSTGLAWDERIHSSAKSLTPKGEWRSRKGADKSLIKMVELELRAKYGSVNAATPATADVVPVPPTSAGPSREAALEYATAQAYRVAGPSPIDAGTLEKLLTGKPATFTLTPQQNDWYAVFYAKRNAAFAEFMQGNVAPVAPAASVSPTPTGNEVAAQPASPSIPVVSPTAAVITQTPAPVAQPGEGLDAVGLPWDERINVGAKIKDAQGVWVQRHDVPPQTKLDIIAELRATLAGNAAVQQSTGQNGAAGATPVAPTPPAAPVAVTADTARNDFPSLLKWIAANQVQGRLTPKAAPDVARDLGFAGVDGEGQMILLRDQPTFWPYMVDLLLAQGAQ